MFSWVLEICFAVVAPRRPYYCVTDSILAFFSPRVDLSALLMLPFLPTPLLCFAAAIGLFDPLGLALLGGILPLPLSLRESTTLTFSGYRAVLGTRLLDIPFWVPDRWISSSWYQIVICFRRRNGMKVAGDYEFGGVLCVRQETPTKHIGGYHTRWS